MKAKNKKAECKRAGLLTVVNASANMLATFVLVNPVSALVKEVFDSTEIGKEFLAIDHADGRVYREIICTPMARTLNVRVHYEATEKITDALKLEIQADCDAMLALIEAFCRNNDIEENVPPAKPEKAPAQPVQPQHGQNQGGGQQGGGNRNQGGGGGQQGGGNRNQGGGNNP